MSGNKPAGEITEHKLVHGWTSAPRVGVFPLLWTPY
jgi:hypothetical protein